MLGRVHTHSPASAVGKAVRLIPTRLRELVACEFVIGVDPVFAGVHTYAESDNGWAYKDVAHCVQPYHQPHRPVSDRGVKVVLPTNPQYGWESWRGVGTVVHELGHVLHHHIGEDWEADPMTEYAHTNRHEAFAEAFRLWVWGDQIDERTTALLNQLVDGYN